jgi:hypothetical protein
MAVLWFAREGIDSTTGFAAYIFLSKSSSLTWEANVTPVPLAARRTTYNFRGAVS